MIQIAYMLHYKSSIKDQSTIKCVLGVHKMFSKIRAVLPQVILPLASIKEHLHGIGTTHLPSLIPGFTPRWKGGG